MGITENLEILFYIIDLNKNGFVHYCIY